jgi:UDP-N-acetylglucosamine acyltransferase
VLGRLAIHEERLTINVNWRLRVQIHPSAIVHPKASLADDVEVGPFCLIGEHVTIGTGTRLLSHVTVDGWTEIGERNELHPFVSIGGPPQHLGYKGEPTKVIIGDDNILREYVTVNRATVQGGGVTSLGSKNFLMAYVHVAHDCRLGNHLIMANAASLAGHITIGDHAIIGGLTGIHQHVRIGAYSISRRSCGLRVAIAHGCMASTRWGCADRDFRPIGFRC